MTPETLNISGRCRSNQTNEIIQSSSAWNGKHFYFSINPLHAAISYIACGVLASLGCYLSIHGYRMVGIPLTLLGCAGVPYINHHSKNSQIALDKHIQEFLPHHYGVEDFSDIPGINWQSFGSMIRIPFNIETKLAAGKDQTGKIVFFISVNRQEKTVNVFTFDKAYDNKEFRVVIDNKEIALTNLRKEIGFSPK